MEKFCSNCGNELKAGADVCLKCGRKLTQQKIIKNNNDSTVLTIAIICVVAFFGFLFFSMLLPILVTLFY